MPLTLAQLRTIITRDDALADIIVDLQSLGFHSTSWQSGSGQRTMPTAMAQTYATMTNSVDALSRHAFNDTSEGDALTAFSASHYDNDRTAATATVGSIVLTGGAVGPPHVVAVGDVVCADATGRTFRNTTGGTVPVSGTVTLTFQAEVTGTDGNVANATITTMQTPLAGVTCNNPDPGTGSWITSLGTDAESDTTLRARNTAKWGIVSVSDPADRYEYFIRTAVSGAVRVEVDDANPDGPGTLRAYIASATGVSPGADVTATQTELERIKNPTAVVSSPSGAYAADAQPQAFEYTAYVLTASNTTATQTAIETALRGYVNGLPIGGDVFPDAAIGIFVRGECEAAMTALTGVERIAWTLPVGNVNITAHDIMTVASITATYTSI
jgi:hypothetical protein